MPSARAAFLILGFIAPFATLIQGSALAEEPGPIVISAADIPEHEVLAVLPLVFHSSLDPVAVVNVDPGRDVWAVPMDEILAAATQDQDVKALAASRSTTVAQLDHEEIIDRMRQSAGMKIVTFANSDGSGDGVRPTSHRAIYETLVNLDQDRVQKVRFSFSGDGLRHRPARAIAWDSKVGVRIDSDYARALRLHSEAVHRAKDVGSAAAGNPFALHQTETLLSNASALKGAPRYQYGEVTFGRPLAFRAQDKQLKIEPSLAQQFDVYWIEFAITPRPIASSGAAIEINDINFSISLSDTDGIALELVPYEYGNVYKHQERLSTPEIGVETKAGTVSVGEFYSRTVQYEYMKPTINALGLRESNFGWLMRDEMAHPGSKRFICILGVPRGTKTVDLALAVSATLGSPAWWGSTEVVSTDPQPVTIALPR